MSDATTTTRLVLISTGGTIEKTYDARVGDLANRGSVLDHMLGTLRLPGLEIERVAVMDKDSLEMTSDDHALIARTATEHAARDDVDGVVVVHGTDRLAESGEATTALGHPSRPIVFTGAMRPYEVRDTDAVQNLTEALLAAQLAPPGVHLAMHGRVLTFPGVVKDAVQLTFRSQR